MIRFGDERLPKRFWRQVFPMEDGCWIYVGARTKKGYGNYSIKHVDYRAHRVAYEHLVGPILEETLDHLCRNRACVNPGHLEPCSVKENTMRGRGAPAVNSRKTACPRGHPLSGENLRFSRRGDGRLFRQCVECIRVRQRVGA